ncbi:hypothetical protein BJ165DRAFT_758750 [Panaeolus papilionaceus]|nr:hypothetical protein BJ165DRAFT_758750 [Panaeolus papilionaceus]
MVDGSRPGLLFSFIAVAGHRCRFIQTSFFPRFDQRHLLYLYFDSGFSYTRSLICGSPFLTSSFRGVLWSFCSFYFSLSSDIHSWFQCASSAHIVALPLPRYSPRYFALPHSFYVVALLARSRIFALLHHQPHPPLVAYSNLNWHLRSIRYYTYRMRYIWGNTIMYILIRVWFLVVWGSGLNCYAARMTGWSSAPVRLSAPLPRHLSQTH